MKKYFRSQTKVASRAIRHTVRVGRLATFENSRLPAVIREWIVTPIGAVPGGTQL